MTLVASSEFNIEEPGNRCCVKMALMGWGELGLGQRWEWGIGGGKSNSIVGKGKGGSTIGRARRRGVVLKSRSSKK